MQQINIVISGFTPYEGIDVNPAVLVPAAVAKQWADPAQSQAISEELLQDIAVTVTNVTLPVSFAKAWPTLLEAIEQAKPDIVIATGLKRTSRGILLERCATNLMDAARSTRKVRPRTGRACRCGRYCTISPNTRFPPR